MKKKYRVTFKKIHIYEVEAENMDEAVDIACEMDTVNKDADISWILDPADEIITEELET